MFGIFNTNETYQLFIIVNFVVCKSYNNLSLIFTCNVSVILRMRPEAIFTDFYIF